MITGSRFDSCAALPGIDVDEDVEGCMEDIQVHIRGLSYVDSVFLWVPILWIEEKLRFCGHLISWLEKI